MRNHPARGETAGERRAEHGTYGGGGPVTGKARAQRWARAPAEGLPMTLDRRDPTLHSWIILMHGHDESDPLFLQVKEAAAVLSRYCGASRHANQRQWVIAGQRLMPPAGDIFLGWQRTEAAIDRQQCDFYAQRLRDWRYSFDIGISVRHGLRLCGERCGWTLARAYARSGDRIAIAAYLDGSDVFDPGRHQVRGRLRRSGRARPPSPRRRRRLRANHRRT
jgi:Uncharacterized protein conserved in bacteria (DUF2252)